MPPPLLFFYLRLPRGELRGQGLRLPPQPRLRLLRRGGRAWGAGGKAGAVQRVKMESFGTHSLDRVAVVVAGGWGMGGGGSGGGANPKRYCNVAFVPTERIKHGSLFGIQCTAIGNLTFFSVLTLHVYP